MIFLDWAAERPAKLVAFERWNRLSGVVKVILGVQGSVPQELIGTAMKRICPRASDGIDDSTRSFSVVGRVVTGQNRKLLNGVHTETAAEHAAGCPVGII